MRTLAPAVAPARLVALLLALAGVAAPAPAAAQEGTVEAAPVVDEPSTAADPPPAADSVETVPAGSAPPGGTAAPEAFPSADEFRQSGAFAGERTDADGDGVPDIDDNCPATPKQQASPVGILLVQVDECGCPKDPCDCDSDGDGVPDCRDVCTHTPLGQFVGEDGCLLPVTPPRREELNVLFEFEKWDVLPEFGAIIDKVRDELLAHRNLIVTFEGHTDWKGSQEYNQPLSEKRAQACAAMLLRDSRILPARVRAVGFGELLPVADNSTDEGRARNRRCTATFSDLRTQ